MVTRRAFVSGSLNAIVAAAVPAPPPFPPPPPSLGIVFAR